MSQSTRVQTTSHQLTCDDGYPLTATVYDGASAGDILIIAPALAAPQGFYQAFARYLAGRGFACITFDYRGTGDSIAEQSPFNIKLEDWGRLDVEAIIRFAESLDETQSVSRPIHFLGHSIGGQLVGLAPSSERLSKIAHVAVSAPYWRRWPFPGNLRMLAAAKVLIPFWSVFRQQFPSQRVGLGTIPVPASTVRQWAKWMGRPDYFFDPRFGLDLSVFSKLKQPLLALGFSDDGLAPQANIEHLLRQFPNADITRQWIDPKELGQRSIRHAGFFKERFRETLWQSTADWLSNASC